MSVLQDRLTSGNQVTAVRPYGTPATPMVMPLAKVTYEAGTLSYAELVPLWTGDVNAAPIAAETPGAWGRVARTARP